MTNNFPVKRSIKQGCPLAPLLFAIAANSLGWLLQEQIVKEELHGLRQPNGEQMVCQQFADDTNLLIQNSEEDIKTAIQCLEKFFLASGSKVNHEKTGFHAINGAASKFLSDKGCKEIQKGQIFRLLGIPMGFGTSMQ